MINIAALEGRAIKTNESATVWIILNGRKFSFSSQNGYNLYSAANPALGLDPEFRNLVIVSAADATSIPDGGSVNDQGILNAIPLPLNNLSQRLARPLDENFRGDSELEASIDLKARSLANEFVKQIRNQASVAASGRVFTRFEPVSDILDNQQVQVTTGLFSSNAATMSAVFTSSLQSTTSKNYYYEAWNGTATISEPQFSVAYGHRRGSGSSAAGTLNDSPSRAIYSQYRLLLLNPGDTAFTFGDGTSSDSIYAINYNRARLKDRIDPGNWQLTLAQLSGSTVPNASHTGSNVRVQTLNPNFITLIDDSGDVNNTGNIGLGNIYNIVSGSLTNGIFNPSAPRYYGLMYPSLGVIILNDTVLNASASFNSVTGSNVAGDNAWKLFTSISGAMSSNVNFAMQARNIETITSTHYFVRVKNGEYNFSNNPTFVTGSVGEFSQATFIGDPKTYLTTIGMYNDRQELLAVAKLSQPVQKSFSVETLIKVKLDF
jgi:hypothetical protein